VLSAAPIARQARTALRWVLVPLAAAIAWALSIAVGVALHNGIERLCPADQFISGLCVAPWFPFVERLVFCASAALAAGLILISCTFTAPKSRRVVAAAVFAIGSVIALGMAVAAGAYLEGATAIGTGFLVCAWLRRRAGQADAARQADRGADVL
jgi:hypothetical protein